jgi:hypothetical protein
MLPPLSASDDDREGSYQVAKIVSPLEILKLTVQVIVYPDTEHPDGSVCQLDCDKM